MSSKAHSIRSVLYALSANLAIAVAKAVAAAYTGSGALLAEAIHSTADSGNQLLLLWGMKSARRPPTADYPLGFGKAIYFWSFIVALLLFSIGGLFSLYEGLHKLTSPEPITTPWIAIGVLLFSVIAEGLSFAGCLREINRVRAGRSLWRWFRDSRESELLVVFGEDFAALIGLAFALLAVSLTMLTGNPVFDALGTLIIGLLLLVVALLIGVEVKNLLIGQSVAPERELHMRAYIEQHPHVERLFNLLTLQMGHDVMVAIKAEMVPCDSNHELIRRINEVEAGLQQHFPEVLWSFFEPDFED